MKVVLFLPTIPLSVLYLPKLTLLLCAEVERAYVGVSCLEIVTREMREPCHSLHLFESATNTPGLQCYYSPGLSSGNASTIPGLQCVFCSVSAKKNIIIRMKTMHQTSPKIKYCSPLSHSEISVKWRPYDSFVYHQLEPSWEQHVVCCFVKLASCCRSSTYFWSLGSFNISALEKKTLWHSFSLFAHWHVFRNRTKSKKDHPLLGLFLLLFICVSQNHSALADSIKLHLVCHSSTINIHS